MKALFTYNYGTKAMENIRDLGYDVIIESEKTIENNEKINDAEVLVCYDPFDRLDLSQMKKLKLIILSSVGFDQLPFDQLENREIIITNNQGGYSKPMGEWIVLNILEILKDRKYFYEHQQKQQWSLNKNVLELVNKKVLFLGTGTIATNGAKRLQGFEAKIHGVNTSGHKADYFDETFKMANILEILPSYDVVVSTLPKIDATYHIIDDTFFDTMKDDSIFINISRGSVVDEEALINFLEQKKFLGVALDVFEEEPLDETSKLWNFDRLYMSFHNSWISEKRNDRRFEMILENLKRFKNDEQLINVVNIERGY